MLITRRMVMESINSKMEISIWAAGKKEKLMGWELFRATEETMC